MHLNIRHSYIFFKYSLCFFIIELIIIPIFNITPIRFLGLGSSNWVSCMNSNIKQDLETLRPVKKSKNQVSAADLWMYRIWVLIRFVTAAIGGYALAVLSTIIISRVFIAHPVDAVMSATLLSFLLHVGAFIWVFMVNSHIKACLGILIPVAGLYAIHLAIGA